MHTLSLILLAVVALSGASIVIYTLGNGISPSPTTGKVKRRLLKSIADLPCSGHIYELGSGWGTLVIPIAKQFGECHVHGYENSIVPYTVSRVRRLLGPPNLNLHWRNFMKSGLGTADVVVCYQSPGNMSRLRPKFEEELKNNAYVISNTFAVPGWKPTETHRVDDLFNTCIYVYRVGDAKSSRPTFVN